MEVRDLFEHGGERFVYRLTIEPAPVRVAATVEKGVWELGPKTLDLRSPLFAVVVSTSLCGSNWLTFRLGGSCGRDIRAQGGVGQGGDAEDSAQA
ncbi:MAG: hypothetical protein CM1200mP2_24980 [Planctomycetaceae bacterium]|nr:MAG: hypothetical protein CM1200mP2_24980 [Planctomycetaceae bacterium]